jgi:hypothetical protein
LYGRPRSAKLRAVHLPDAAVRASKSLLPLTVAATLTSAALLGCRAPTPATPAACPKPTIADACSWQFLRYEPSPWERQWHQGEVSGERRDKECEVLATPVEVDRAVRLIRSVQNAVLRREMIPAGSIELFSRMVYAERCNGRSTGRTRAQLIEPLVGIVRDPLTMCPRPPAVPEDVYVTFAAGEDFVQSKRNLLIGPAAPWSDNPKDPSSWSFGGFEPWGKPKPSGYPSRVRQNMLIDMGASTYGGWGGNAAAAGASWFVDRYKTHGLDFDWVVSYEYDKHDPDEIYRSVPIALVPHYLYYNQPVEGDPDGKWNPWRIMRGMGVTADDYVVVKLDIDTPNLEHALFQQVLFDAKNTELIDEFFYEQHVNTKVMSPAWGPYIAGNVGERLTMIDTYDMFTAMRSRGVRMHSWP